MARAFHKNLQISAPTQVFGPNPARKALWISTRDGVDVFISFAQTISEADMFPCHFSTATAPFIIDDSNCPGVLQGPIWVDTSGAGGFVRFVEISNP